MQIEAATRSETRLDYRGNLGAHFESIGTSLQPFAFRRTISPRCVGEKLKLYFSRASRVSQLSAIFHTSSTLVDIRQLTRTNTCTYFLLFVRSSTNLHSSNPNLCPVTWATSFCGEGERSVVSPPKYFEKLGFHALRASVMGFHQRTSFPILSQLFIVHTNVCWSFVYLNCRDAVYITHH